MGERRSRGGRAATRRFPATPESVHPARAWVREVLRGRGFGADVCESAQLLVSELATNAVRHTDSPTFDVRVSAGAFIELRIDDHGRGAELVRVPAVEPGDVGGRGLAIVDALCDAWGVRATSSGTSVWLRLALPAASQGR